MTGGKNYEKIPADKFRFVQGEKKAQARQTQRRSTGYFADAWRRFCKNKGAVAAFGMLVVLLAFALVVPFFTDYTVAFRDKYYKAVLPKAGFMAGTGIWDGTRVQDENEAGYEYLCAVGMETGREVVTGVEEIWQSADGETHYRVRVDSYAKVGFIFADLSAEEYARLQEYQNENGIQVMYPMQETYNVNFAAGNSGANFWYKLENEGYDCAGGAALDENGEYVHNYMTSDDPHKAGYASLRIKGDDGDGGWYVYAVKNQTGYRTRLDYYEYFVYQNGFEPVFLLGTNSYGQDILTCLAAGARLSFLLAFVVSLINFVIGSLYGAVEGYYGGTADIVMERIAEILGAVPFVVVATLFRMHMADKAGVLGSLLFAFVLTGWLGMAARVRMQFYRFKGQEYILAARTLGAGDARLIFRHIFPNAIGTIITDAVLAIPGVIFAESVLSYLGVIDLETASLTSIGTMLAAGQGYLSTYPHIILFPALFISVMEISFNLLGNGLRDAFDPSLRGADE